jgi:hypothetical protein
MNHQAQPGSFETPASTIRHECNLLPASIVCRGKGNLCHALDGCQRENSRWLHGTDLGFDRVVEAEKSGGIFEHGIDFGLADAMVDNAKEAYVLRGLDQFTGNLVNSRVEVGKRYGGNDALEVFRLPHIGC